MRTDKRTVLILLVVTLLVGGCLWYAFTPAPKNKAPSITGGNIAEEDAFHDKNYVLVNLTDMNVYLKHGTTTLDLLPIISIGKPDSYYETLGGIYPSDYKMRNHFSSIGHVYMPWSTHIFGNFFIHGIPYYPDGRSVSSAYSGGCIRLSDNDAHKVYDFVEKGMPLIVTFGNKEAFTPTQAAHPTRMSKEVTRYMVATVSLEVLTQDNTIIDTNNATPTTRRKLLPRLIVNGDDTVSKKLAQDRGEQTFIDYMNQKAVALGMSNTHFSSLTEPVATTPQDIERFKTYLAEYKTYLLSLSTSTLPLFQ